MLGRMVQTPQVCAGCRRLPPESESSPSAEPQAPARCAVGTAGAGPRATGRATIDVNHANTES